MSLAGALCASVTPANAGVTEIDSRGVAAADVMLEQDVVLERESIRVSGAGPLAAVVLYRKDDSGSSMIAFVQNDEDGHASVISEMESPSPTDAEGLRMARGRWRITAVASSGPLRASWSTSGPDLSVNPSQPIALPVHALDVPAGSWADGANQTLEADGVLLGALRIDPGVRRVEFCVHEGGAPADGSGFASGCPGGRAITGPVGSSGSESRATYVGTGYRAGLWGFGANVQGLSTAHGTLAWLALTAPAETASPPPVAEPVSPTTLRRPRLSLLAKRSGHAVRLNGSCPADGAGALTVTFEREGRRLLRRGVRCAAGRFAARLRLPRSTAGRRVLVRVRRGADSVYRARSVRRRV